MGKGLGENIRDSIDQSINPTEQQIDKMAQHGLDAEGIKDIENVRNDLTRELKAAHIEGIINKDDADKLERKLVSASADKSEVYKVGHEISGVIDKNRNMIDSFVKQLSAEPDISRKLDVKDHINRFKALSTEEKQKFHDNLRNNLDFLQALYKVVAQHTPDKLGEFKNLDGHGKKELKLRAENVSQYQKLLDENKELFSGDSAKDWMRQFKDLTDVKEQKAWIDKFHEAVADKKAIMDRFKAFPEAFRTKHPNFANLRKSGKEVALQQMERQMEEAYDEALQKDPNAKHFSAKDKEAAKKLWKQRPDLHAGMIQYLPKFLASAAEKAKVYEKLSPVEKLDLQERLGIKDFYELDLESKDKAVKSIDKNREEMNKQEQKYQTGIDKAVTMKYMSKESAKDFMDEFKDRTTKGRQEWIDKFDNGPESELGKRKAVTEAFQKLPPDIQAKYQDFYEKGYTDRHKLVVELTGGEPVSGQKERIAGAEGKLNLERLQRLSDSATKLEREGNNAANKDQQAEKWREALDTYEEALHFDPQDEIAQAGYTRVLNKIKTHFPDIAKNLDKGEDAQTISNSDIHSTMNDVKQSSDIKDDVRRLNIARQFTNLVEKNQAANNNATKFEQQNKTMDAKTKIINERLQEHTDGGMVVGADGQANDVQELDIKRIDQVQDQDLNALQNVVADHKKPGEDRTFNAGKLINKESGQEITREQGKAQVTNLKDFAQEQIARRTAQKLKARGKTMNEADKAALEAAAANDELEKTLEKTGS